MENFIISKDFVKKVKRFNLQGRTLEFKLKPVPNGADPLEWIKKAVQGAILHATSDLQPTDKVGFTFCSKAFAEKGSGWVDFREAGDVTVEDVWNVLASIFQSNSEGLNTDTFCLGVTSVRTPVGKGKGKNYNTFEEECGKRRGIIVINNKDNMCLPRALVVAIACSENDPDQCKVRKDTGKIQTQRAFKLVQEAGVIIPREGAGIPELQQFQRHLQNYNIVVYLYGNKGRDVMFEGNNEGIKTTINLIYHEGHFNVITSLTAAFACSYYCEECHIPYNVKNKHRCVKSCPCCQQTPPCQQESNITCEKCNRKFRGQNCLENHKKGICEMIKQCDNCLKTVIAGREHICGEVYCKICCTHVQSGHLCYMPVDKKHPKTEDNLFVFYDLETRQERENGSSRVHEPNLCVFANRCNSCIQEDNLYFCQKCGYRLVVYREAVIDSFIKYLLEARKKFKYVVVVAHNGQSFDHQFILNYLLTRTNLKPEIIMRGTKILLMEFQNIKFIDSLNYFPMALSKLPKAFDLPAIFKKGYFPHLFNTEKNEGYVGPLPALEYYDPDRMMPEDREVFLKWYEDHKLEEFNMQRDLAEYCISDVQILTRACVKFRELFLSECKVCPFTEACTIASACNKTFRRNFLKPNTIGIIPKGGYRYTDTYSRIGVQWLIWEEQERNINIQHAAKGREAEVIGFKVDGYCAETRQVFEFHGCYFHGCRSCFKFNRDEPSHEDSCETLNSRHESTVAKTDRLRKYGYEVLEMWECQFRRLLKSSKEIEEYVENHPLNACRPLNPRDAFYGGRTGNTRTYYKCQPGEKIKYVDVCSLYPWVCKYGKFPIGHPEVYVGDKCPRDLNRINGLVKCKILPPQELYHPVLPTKMNDKLMFVLCRTCGQNMEQGECIHNEEERSLSGTWVTDEVVKAVEKGYEIKEIYEIWKYDVVQFDKMKKIGGLFSSMMDKFLKMKQQASGWPSNCSVKAEKDKYIEEYFSKEGVQLEFSEILKNPGLRSLAKLMLNSFWGKLGQRENQSKTKIIDNPGEFFDMMSNSAILVQNILPINENTLIVNWRYREEAYDVQATVNVCLAAYTTTQARLKLYSYLEQLGERVLYYDTDSVIYVSTPGEYDVPVGNMLGEMTDELEGYGVGSYIAEFVSGGPKNYAYTVYSTKDDKIHVVCKIKGICLNYSASQIVNLESMKDMVLSACVDPVYITSNQIRRTKDHQIISVSETKIYRPNSTKRKFSDDHASFPFGYKQVKIERQDIAIK